MATHNVPGLGPVDFADDGQGYWEATARLGRSEVPVDFNTDGASMSPALLQRVQRFVEDLAGFDERARAGIAADFDAGDCGSRLYLSHHLEELDAEERMACFGTEDTEIGLDALMAALTLKRVGLYPEDEEKLAVFDYSIGPDVTDYILAVEFNPDGSLLAVSMES